MITPFMELFTYHFGFPFLFFNVLTCIDLPLMAQCTRILHACDFWNMYVLNYRQTSSSVYIVCSSMHSTLLFINRNVPLPLAPSILLLTNIRCNCQCTLIFLCMVRYKIPYPFYIIINTCTCRIIPPFSFL